MNKLKEAGSRWKDTCVRTTMYHQEKFMKLVRKVRVYQCQHKYYVLRVPKERII